MSYPIEILATSRAEIAGISSAIESLNKVQNEFRFSMPVERLQEEAYSFVRENYQSDEVADWLDEYRTRNRGYRPYLIIILSGTLNGNHFGGHVARHGFAFFTLDSHHQFVIDKIRFIRYYLTRYALSFVNPDIKNHETRDCMFDAKSFKEEIQLSLQSGRVCDDCRKKLEVGGPEVINAVGRMLLNTSNRHPYALVMKGGGAKGLALIGALLELEKHYSFDTFSGTSAGAIAAVLLATGYSPNELRNVLMEHDFEKFIEGGPLNWLLNLISKGGAITGKEFVSWLESLLRKRIHSTGVLPPRMMDLPMRAIVYASTVAEGVITYDSSGSHKEAKAQFAVRCSMSIPGVFRPMKLDDGNVYDGGLGNNFPLRKFLADNPNQLFIGLYLKGDINSKTIVGELFDVATDADERDQVRTHIDKIVIIDPSPIGTMQFKLDGQQKEFLLNAGKLGALEFLHRHNPESRVSDKDVVELRTLVENQRNALKYRPKFKWLR